MRDIDVLCIGETWIEPNIEDSHLSIPGYKIFRCDYGRGGGVCVYVKSDLSATLINLDTAKVPGIEDLWITVQSRKLPSVIIGCIYRHPKSPSSTFDILLDKFRTIVLRKKPVFILGDINDNQLVPNSRLSKIINTCKLTQLIDKPTRITENSKTLLDVIITNNPNMVKMSDVIPGPIADHELITVNINIDKPKRKPIKKTFRCQRNYNADEFCLSLMNEERNFAPIINTDDVHLQVNIFNEVFTKCLNSCAPIVEREIYRPYAPWINEEVKSAMRSRDTLQKQLKSRRYDSLLQEQYKSAKKKVRSLIKTRKKEYYSEKLRDCKGKSSNTWKVIKEAIPKNTDETHNFDNVKEKAEEFNNYFANVGRNAYLKSQEQRNINIPDQNNHLNLASNVDRVFRPQPVDINTVTLIIKDLNNTNSCGSDGIQLKYIRDALPIIIFYITFIVNTSIVTGVFPKPWKYPYVNPFYKSGDRGDVANYRPISILPILSKVLEKIVANQLIDFLESNNLLSESQHGFRPRLSTETALMKVTEKIYDNIDKKNISLLLLLDLSKAFDSISHNILIKKLKSLNIDSFWFSSYLQDRRQSVRIDNTISSPKEISYGVPPYWGQYFFSFM